MEQLVILLLIALISIINWIIQKSKEAREKRKLEKRADATGEPVAKREPAPDAAGTETAMRRLREALAASAFARPDGPATASGEKARSGARAAGAPLGGTSQVRIAPQDGQAFATRGAATASSGSRTSPVPRRLA
jgi:hypothetical protein